MNDDLISRQALCDYALNQKDKSVTPNDIMRFPSAQPEITEEDVREWCYKRCLTIIDNALYLEMRSRWLPSAQQEIIYCKECSRYSNGYCHHPDTYGMYVDTNHFCGYAERMG